MGVTAFKQEDMKCKQRERYMSETEIAGLQTEGYNLFIRRENLKTDLAKVEKQILDVDKQIQEKKNAGKEK